jgi:putative transposase
LVLAVVVTAANIQDRQAAGWLLTDVHLSAVKLDQMKVWADQGYTGEYVEEVAQLYELDLEIVRPQGRGFKVLPKRWVVERTFGWLSLNRRLSRDNEQLETTTEAWVYLGMVRLMLRRLA